LSGFPSGKEGGWRWVRASNKESVRKPKKRLLKGVAGTPPERKEVTGLLFKPARRNCSKGAQKETKRQPGTKVSAEGGVQKSIHGKKAHLLRPPTKHRSGKSGKERRKMFFKKLESERAHEKRVSKIPSR